MLCKVHESGCPKSLRGSGVTKAKWAPPVRNNTMTPFYVLLPYIFRKTKAHEIERGLLNVTMYVRESELLLDSSQLFINKRHVELHCGYRHGAMFACTALPCVNPDTIETQFECALHTYRLTGPLACPSAREALLSSSYFLLGLSHVETFNESPD